MLVAAAAAVGAVSRSSGDSVAAVAMVVVPVVGAGGGGGSGGRLVGVGRAVPAAPVTSTVAGAYLSARDPGQACYAHNPQGCPPVPAGHEEHIRL